MLVPVNMPNAVAYADFNLSYLVFGANAGLAEILGGLPRHIAQRLATAVTSGDEVWGLALTEPRGGSDAARPTVRAEQVDGGFRLTGEKTSVTLGMHSREILAVATTDPSAGSRATRRFLVPADDLTITRQQFRDPGFRPLGRAGIAEHDTKLEAARWLCFGPSVCVPRVCAIPARPPCASGGHHVSLSRRSTTASCSAATSAGRSRCRSNRCCST
jgi:alkylation response protein AidB-like acyl-CoA dehydrogenase